MTYKLTTGDIVIRQSDGAAIPRDPANRDWQEYQAFLDAGGQPMPADLRQGDGADAMAKRQNNDVLEALDTAIDKLPADQRVAFTLVRQLLEK